MIKDNGLFNGLEIAKTDFPKQMNYEEAVLACKKLGEGWRLPTIREALEIFDGNTRVLGDFNNETYLTSTFSNSGGLWAYFHSAKTDQHSLENVDFLKGKVRPVRSTDSYKQDCSYLYEIAKLLKQYIHDNKKHNVITQYWEISGAKIVGQYTWFEAVEICKLLGDGWRLPSDAEEVEDISKLVDMYGYYWTEETSGMYGKKNNLEATAGDVDGCFAGSSLFNKKNTSKIMLLRDLDS